MHMKHLEHFLAWEVLSKVLAVIVICVPGTIAVSNPMVLDYWFWNMNECDLKLLVLWIARGLQIVSQRYDSGMEVGHQGGHHV